MPKNKTFRFQMLKRALSYGKRELSFLITLSPLIGDEWDGDLIRISSNAKTKRDKIKKNIKKRIQKIQGNNCIYCGWSFELVGVSEREHIAPKGKHREFTFEPYNLALACAYCNSSSKKGTTDTISKKKPVYNNCTFNIIHPYFDDFEKHIKFFHDKTDNKILILPQKWSRKGKATIDMFELNGIAQSLLRAGYAMQRHIKLDKAGNDIINSVISKSYF